MKKDPKKTSRPGRRTKGAHNTLLPAELQGRAYRVRSYNITPVITLLTPEGLEERHFAGPNLTLCQAHFGKSISEFMALAGLKTESSEGGA